MESAAHSEQIYSLLFQHRAAEARREIHNPAAIRRCVQIHFKAKLIDDGIDAVGCKLVSRREGFSSGKSHAVCAGGNDTGCVPLTIQSPNASLSVRKDAAVFFNMNTLSLEGISALYGTKRTFALSVGCSCTERPHD